VQDGTGLEILATEQKHARRRAAENEIAVCIGLPVDKNRALQFREPAEQRPARDLVFGELAWLVVRLTLVAVLFFAVMLVFRIPQGPEAALAIPAAVLNGLAFATPILAFTATQTRDTSFSAIQRFLIMPLFLFAGAFFPIAQLPHVLQAVAWLTPLAHGVSLVRGLTLGTLTQSAALVDIGVLLAYTLAGGVGAAITFRRRLIK